MTIQKLKNSIVIDNRYQMFYDGTIYDNENASDIPQWIFEFRNFVIKNAKTMEQSND